MPYYGDIYNSIFVVDFVHNPIFAHSYTPKLAGALKFFATMRSRILCQRFNPREYASGEAARQTLQLSPCRPGEDDLEGGHLSSLKQSVPDFCERFARLLLPLFGQ